MAQTPRFFSPTNVFIPAATGEVIGYIRKPGQFKLLDYVQLVKSTSQDDGGKPICVFAVLDPDAPVRTGPRSGPTVTNPSIAGTNMPSVDVRWRWAPGDDRPSGNIVNNFYWQSVEMMRRAYPYEYDEQMKNSADLPVGNIYRQVATSVAMTVKTDRVIQMLQTAANWPTTNTADANTLNGGRGKWSQATSDENSPNFGAIRIAVAQAVTNIVQFTNGAVRPEDLRVIISPNVALQLGSTGEIYTYVKSSPFSQARQEGKNQLNEQYLMPKYYAGVEWIVEDTPIVLEDANSAGTVSTVNRQWVKNDTSAIIVSRKGGLNGVYGAPSFSTVQLFYYKYELAIEEMYDAWNKKHKGSVVDQYAEVLAAQRAGFLITSIL